MVLSMHARTYAHTDEWTTQKHNALGPSIGWQEAQVSAVTNKPAQRNRAIDIA